MTTLENPRYERLAQELAGGATAHAAHTAAGFAPCRKNAARLAKSPKVQARVAEILGQAAERVEITQAMVLAELAKVGFSDIRKLFGPGGALKRVEDLDDETAAFVSSVKVVTRRVPGGDEGEVERVSEIKQWDKLSALDKIGKHLGMFTEKVEHTGKDGGPIEIGDTDLARLIAFQLTKAAKAS